MAPLLRGDSALNYQTIFSQLASGIASAVDSIPKAAWLDLDRSLERSMAEEILKEDEVTIRTELRKKFGLASFNEEPTKVLRRVKRAGKISNEEEAELVDRYLAGDFLGGFMSEAERKRFSEIARTHYENQKRPPRAG